MLVLEEFMDAVDVARVGTVVPQDLVAERGSKYLDFSSFVMTK
jgi:hypothetical protein